MASRNQDLTATVLEEAASHQTPPAFAVPTAAIHACGAGVDSHEKLLRNKGFAEEKVVSAVRVTSDLQAIATMLDPEVVAAQRPLAVEGQ